MTTQAQTNAPTTSSRDFSADRLALSNDAARLGPKLRTFTKSKSAAGAGVVFGVAAVAYGLYAIWTNLVGGHLAWVGLGGGALAAAFGGGIIYKFITLRNVVTIHAHGFQLEAGMHKAVVQWAEVVDVKLVETNVVYNGARFRERGFVVTTSSGDVVAANHHQFEKFDELVNVLQARGGAGSMVALDDDAAIDRGTP